MPASGHALPATLSRHLCHNNSLQQIHLPQQKLPQQLCHVNPFTASPPTAISPQQFPQGNCRPSNSPTATSSQQPSTTILAQQLSHRNSATGLCHSSKAAARWQQGCSRAAARWQQGSSIVAAGLQLLLLLLLLLLFLPHQLCHSSSVTTALLPQLCNSRSAK